MNWFWIIFNLVVVLLLIIDLKFVHRKSHTISVKEALWTTAFWISLALLFNLGVYKYKGKEAALQFFAGYLVEYSLSVDNIFVFLMLFSYFKIPKQYMHKILFWGILGAIVMRGIFILIGVALIETFSWIFYVFGAFLVYTGFKLAIRSDESLIDPKQNFIVRLCSKFINTTQDFHGGQFFAIENGKKVATPLFITLLAVEASDLVFAVDSIPAIFGITTDPFIVYTSNVFAILGLRSLFFALAGIIELFHYLSYGLSAVLIFIGFKMLIANWYHIPINVSLAIIGTCLGISILASILHQRLSKKP